MRIIAGEFKSRMFKAPRGYRTHPMSERIRGALFAMLGDIEGLTVLDAFSGSGALAFEAVSRGAAHVTAVEQDNKAYKIITENIEKLGIEDRVKATRANISGWSARSDDEFDIVFLDPPYDYLQAELLQRMSKHLKQSGVLVLSWPSHERPLKINACKIISSRNYGDASLHIYKR
jgi:16S rRNA (guanine966-N2)-methyltransferase